MPNVFFTADLHFGHPKIIWYAERPFSTLEEMEQALVANWNAVIRDPEDLVWVLGDYALGDRGRALRMLSRLAGRKMLVSGNHDACSPVHPGGWKHVAEYVDAGFEIVTPWTQTKLPAPRSGAKRQRVLLSHFPYDGDSGSHHPDRYRAARLRDEGQPVLHGHVHDKFTLQHSAKGSIQINVGVDRWNYRPVAAGEIARLIDDAQNRRREDY